MKIGIDISILPKGGGVAKYILNLLEGLKNIAPQNQYKLFINSFSKVDLPKDFISFKIRKTKIPSRILQLFWLRLRFPSIEWLLGNIDLFHSPAHSKLYSYCPPAKRWIVTVHDLFTFKLNYRRKDREKELEILHRIDSDADRVIAVSQSTRNDLIELIPGLESRVVVIPEGVDSRFFNCKLMPEITAKYNIKEPYILYLGAADSHKNLKGLIKIYKKICKLTNHFLVIGGKITDRHKKIVEHVKKLDLYNRVIFTGFVKEEDLPSIYKGADLFVLPTLYEGFGLVLLEAMAAGTPVAASNISSIPEVVGDSAILFDPYNEDDMYKAIYSGINDSVLRDMMKTNGVERARLFSWEKMVKETIRIYEKVSKT